MITYNKTCQLQFKIHLTRVTPARAVRKMYYGMVQMYLSVQQTPPPFLPLSLIRQGI